MELFYRGREIAFEEVCGIFLDPTMVSYDDVGATFRCVARRHSLYKTMYCLYNFNKHQKK